MQIYKIDISNIVMLDTSCFQNYLESNNLYFIKI